MNLKMNVSPCLTEVGDYSTPSQGFRRLFYRYTLLQCTTFDIRKSGALRMFVIITTVSLIYIMAQVNVVSVLVCECVSVCVCVCV